MRPTAAGIRLWMSQAMNDRFALIITLTYMTAIVLVIAADAFIIGEAIAYAFSNGHARRHRLRRGAADRRDRAEPARHQAGRQRPS